MPKGDDYKIKKKNKAIRKKMNNSQDSSAVSARIASIIAAKKRRQSGKRSQCQGMCFSLPSEKDPYNDKHGKDPSIRKLEKLNQLKSKRSLKEIGERPQKRKTGGDEGNTDHHKAKKFKASIDTLEEIKDAGLGKRKTQHLIEGVVANGLEVWTSGDSGCPSKFLLMCLNSVQDSLLVDGELNKEEGKPLFVNPWGVQFWNSYSLDHDILEESGTSPSAEQIAWMASTAADSISRIEKEGISFRNPFLVYLVPSQEKAVKVRSVCKPLKASGVHTVILHPGTSVEHQIQGLKMCEPEFLVATPERLWELILLKAIDISAASLLVVDSTGSLSDCLDVVKNIKDSISGNHRTIVFQGSSSGSSAQAVQKLLSEPFHTLSLGESINSRGIQS